MTRVLDGNDPAALDEAAAILRAGGLVAFPTETVYGLGALGLDETAVRRIFAAKGRPADNPLILHVSRLEEALLLWRASDEQRAQAKRCARALWPGPLTLVLPAAPLVPSVVTAGLGSVAVRAPAHPVALSLLARVGHPLAAPSANASGRPSPTTAAHVLRTLGEAVDAVVDGGPTEVGIESTVLDLTTSPPRVLRPGVVDLERLRALLGEVSAYEGGAALAPSPGLRHRHYAPAIAVVRREDDEGLARAWCESPGLLLRASTAARLSALYGPREDKPTQALPDDPAGYARGLYAALYRLEASGVGVLVVEDLPVEPRWSAARDRLLRATEGSAS
jgi:L-threonylcarbamoyladenylate synthase